MMTWQWYDEACFVILIDFRFFIYLFSFFIFYLGDFGECGDNDAEWIADGML